MKSKLTKGQNVQKIHVAFSILHIFVTVSVPTASILAFDSFSFDSFSFQIVWQNIKCNFPEGFVCLFFC